MASYKRYYGIRFPFTDDRDDGSFVDSNNGLVEEVSSEILHVLLTVRGTKLRDPDFGTDLIRYIFEFNDESLWGDIESDIKGTISRYVKNTEIESISVFRDEANDHTADIAIKFSIYNGGEKKSYELAAKV